MQTLILNHYPPVIKQIKEMQQIAKAEDIEFLKLSAAMNGVAQNMFIQTADENGIERFENMLGITKKEAKNLESRKIRILFMMNRKKTTMSELKGMMEGYCEDMEFVCDTQNMEMIMKMRAGMIEINTISDILEEILPLNIYFHFQTKLNAERTKAGVHALHRTGGKLKVKAFLPDSLKAETGADGKIKAYQRGRQTMKIRKGGN